MDKTSDPGLTYDPVKIKDPRDACSKQRMPERETLSKQ